MKTRDHQFNLNWANSAGDTAPYMTGAQDAPLERVQIPLPAEYGEAWLDIFHIAPGFTLARGVHALEPAPKGQLIPLLEADVHYPELTFSSQIVHGGALSHSEFGPDGQTTDFLSSPGRDIFRYQKNWRSRAFAEGGVTTSMHSIVLKQSLMFDYLGAETAERLLSKFGMDRSTEVVVHPIPAHVSAPLKDAISDLFVGPIRQLLAHAKALEYLAGLTQYVWNDGKPLLDRRRGERRHRARIQELHDHLIELKGEMPTASDLAAEFGLSVRQLNHEFSAEYGMSIFAFTSDLRLEQARLALLDSASSMKAIALGTGYSHVNHFITAFKRKFGYPPGRLRRNKPQNSQD